MNIILIVLWLPLSVMGQNLNLESLAYSNEAPLVEETPPANSAPVPFMATPQSVNSPQEATSQEAEVAVEDAPALMPSDTSIAMLDLNRAWEEYNKNEEENRNLYLRARQLSYWTIAGWLLFMVLAMIYLFIRYQFYSGLERRRYWQLVRKVEADETIAVEDKPQFYPQNPYINETLGMPRGTIRAFLTLTLLIANCLVLYVSVYAPPSTAHTERTEFISTAFLMMIAFYFGSKAVDVFKVREESRRKAIKEGSVDAGTAGVSTFSATPPPPRVAARPPESRPATSPVRLAPHIPDSTVVQPEMAGDDTKLEEKIFAVTAFLETGKQIHDACCTVAGDFDGMGLSMGCLQWNLGQGTLQPILLDYFKYTTDSWQDDPKLVEFRDVLNKPLQEQLAWARSIQTRTGNSFVFNEGWKESLHNLAENTRHFQMKACEPRFDIARNWCRQLGLSSERALALMFDINVQNGSLFKIDPNRQIDVRNSINRRIASAGAPSEEERLVIIAEERAKASNPRWQNDVLSRKLAIARGAGMVHGAQVDMGHFGIKLDRHFA